MPSSRVTARSDSPAAPVLGEVPSPDLDDAGLDGSAVVGTGRRHGTIQPQ